MNADVKNTLARVTNWPEEDREELAQLALEIEARRHGVYHVPRKNWPRSDAALAAIERGEIASAGAVEAVFAKYRRHEGPLLTSAVARMKRSAIRGHCGTRSTSI